jgi:hypothetical protein
MIERVKILSTAARFRDIREDLQDRLRDALNRQKEFSAKATEAGIEADMLQQLIARENQRYPQQADAGGARPDEAFGDFVFKSLLARPKSKEDLRQAAADAGYDVDGRSIHAAIVNLLRTGRIKELHNGVYGVDPAGAAAEVH